jgi:hypothetical protein
VLIKCVSTSTNIHLCLPSFRHQHITFRLWLQPLYILCYDRPVPSTLLQTALSTKVKDRRRALRREPPLVQILEVAQALANQEISMLQAVDAYGSSRTAFRFALGSALISGLRSSKLVIKGTK